MYCTVADVMTRINVSTMPDVNLDFLIQAVTERIERYCDRVFTRVPADGEEERQFLGAGSSILTIDDLLSWTSVTVDDAEVQLTDLRRMPFGKTPTTWLVYESGAEWERGAEVAVEGVWGYSETLPWPVWNAAVAWVVRELERAKTAYQDASASVDVGQLIYAKAVPADIREVLNEYRRMPF